MTGNYYQFTVLVTNVYRQCLNIAEQEILLQETKVYQIQNLEFLPEKICTS